MASFKLLLLAVLLRLAATELIPFDDWLYQRVALPDVNIYFRYAGTGPPILLVHGYPQHSVTAPRNPVGVDDPADGKLKAHMACYRTDSCAELHRDRC